MAPRSTAVASTVPDAILVGDWRVEPNLDRLSRGGESVKLEPRVMRLLLCLIAHVGQNLTVEELLDEVWPDVVVGPDSVYQAIAVLRARLGDSPHRPAYISHLPRRGYRLIAPVGGDVRPVPAVELAEPSAAATAPIPIPEPATPAAGPSRLRWATLAGAVAALAVVGSALLFWKAERTRPAPAVPVAAPDPAPKAPVTTAPSIAVLPFLDLTEKHDLGYFADGLTEELIDLLSRGSDLHVPARTSSFFFKARSVTVSDVGRALNVNHVLEGSVRRSGHKIRVTAQLIRTDDGFHVWSNTYDRDLRDILAVEDDIAQAVVGALQARLLASRFPASTGPRASEAHIRRLQCEYFVLQNTPAFADKSVACFREVLKLDRGDAVAWSEYADAMFRQGALEGWPHPARLAASQRSVEAAQQALAIDPAVTSAYATIATVRRHFYHDWSGAQAVLSSALAQDPDEPATLLAAAALAMNLGQHDKAIELCKRARERDPLNFLSYARLARLYLYRSRLVDAEAAARKRVELYPEGHGGYVSLGDVLLARGAATEALDAGEHEPDPSGRLIGRALAYHALGRARESEAALDQLKRRYARSSAVDIAEIYAYRGDADNAFQWLNRAYASGDTALLSIKVDNYFISLHADPRYQALLKALKLPV